MKKGKKSSFAISEELYAVALKRAENLGHGSYSSYLNGLILMDLITQPSHKLAFRINDLGWRAMEKLVAAVAAHQECPLDQLADEGAVDDLIAISAAYREKREAPITGSRQEGGRAA
jgi:hypothetical protein